MSNSNAVIDWKYVLETVIKGMKSSANKLLPGLDIPALTELIEFRTFRFRAGRQNGKSTGILQYVQDNYDSVIYDGFTSSIYRAKVVDGVTEVKASHKNIKLLDAFEVIANSKVHTLFLNAFDKNACDKFAAFYAARYSEFPKDFILVVEE